MRPSFLLLLVWFGCGGVPPAAPPDGPIPTDSNPGAVCSVKVGWGVEQVQQLLGAPCGAGENLAPVVGPAYWYTAPDCSGRDNWQIDFDQSWRVVSVEHLSGAPCKSG